MNSDPSSPIFETHKTLMHEHVAQAKPDLPSFFVLGPLFICDMN